MERVRGAATTGRALVVALVVALGLVGGTVSARDAVQPTPSPAATVASPLGEVVFEQPQGIPAIPVPIPGPANNPWWRGLGGFLSAAAASGGLVKVAEAVRAIRRGHTAAADDTTLRVLANLQDQVTAIGTGLEECERRAAETGRLLDSLRRATAHALQPAGDSPPFDREIARARPQRRPPKREQGT